MRSDYVMRGPHLLVKTPGTPARIDARRARTQCIASLENLSMHGPPNLGVEW